MPTTKGMSRTAHPLHETYNTYKTYSTQDTYDTYDVYNTYEAQSKYEPLQSATLRYTLTERYESGKISKWQQCHKGGCCVNDGRGKLVNFRGGSRQTESFNRYNRQVAQIWGVSWVSVKQERVSVLPRRDQQVPGKQENKTRIGSRKLRYFAFSVTAHSAPSDWTPISTERSQLSPHVYCSLLGKVMQQVGQMTTIRYDRQWVAWEGLPL